MPQAERFKRQELISHNFRGWESKIKVLVGSISPETSLLGLQMFAFSLPPHMAFALCMQTLGVSFSSYNVP